MENKSNEKLRTIEMSSDWLLLIQPGLYGTEIGDCFCEIDKRYNDEFKDLVKEKYLKELNEFFKENEENITCHSAEFKSPKFYNYRNDWVEFSIDIPELIIEEINKMPDEAFDFFDDYYGSHAGFASFMPYKEEKFYEAIHNPKVKYDFERAIGMYLTWKYRYDMEQIQENFENSIIEYVHCNTAWIPDEEEFEEE